MIRIVNKEPHKDVLKEVVCSNCGVTLEYTPNDVRTEIRKDYTGCGETYKTIDCPNCSHQVNVR